MLFQRQRYRFALLLFLILTRTVNAQSVKIESTSGFDFTNYKKYTWRTHPVFEKRPELAEKYSVGIDLIKNVANQILMPRGFESTQLDPDFYITFLLTGESRQDVDVVEIGGGYGWGGWYQWPSTYYSGWSTTVVSNYVEGVLVLDIVDAKSSQLVWRAYCRDDVKDWKNRDKNVKKTLEKALKRFPPKK
ncbi:MAG TPA: DUF4136 domain-containing protein [Bryobacteraceae bacterium]|nr:DUF4136 domain-containing protein [Bryobacteraceae bacterium]